MATPVPRRHRHPHISRRKDTCSGKPAIAGTRIKVSDVAIEYERLGMTPDEIVQAHPHLSLAQVHDALSYYYDNIAEIDEEIAEDRRAVAEMKRDFVSILLDRNGGERTDRTA